MIFLKNKDIYEAFDRVRAEDELKEKTLRRLTTEIANNTHPQRTMVSPLPNKKNSRRLLAAVITIFILLFGGGSSYHFLFTAHAYVDLDVNPSVSLSLNALKQVIGTDAYNEEGAQLLAELSLKRQPYQEALDTLLTALADQGYLAESDLVSVTVQSNLPNQEFLMQQELAIVVDSALLTHHTSAAAEVYPVSEQLRQQAGEHHLSPAKYLAISELVDLDPTLTFGDCASHSISEIREQTHQHRQRSEHHHN